METRSLLLISCTFALLPFWIYLFYFRRKSTSTLETQRSQDVHLKVLLNYQKECVTFEVAATLSKLLQFSDPDSKLTCLRMIQQASSFSSNFPVFRKSGCLESMLKLLNGNDDSPVVKKQNLCILQSITNFACDNECVTLLEQHLGDIFSIANCIAYSDQACAAIQLLCNIALTTDGCRLLDDRINTLCDMLQSRDPHMLRQIFSLLVNLSCDPVSCDLLLMSKASNNIMDTFSFCLSPEVPSIVTLQAVNFLRNLSSRTFSRFASVLVSTDELADIPTLRNFLWQSHAALLLRLDYLLAELPSMDSADELRIQAENLRSLLIRVSHNPAEQMSY